MVAGMNLRVQIFATRADTDDDIGGARITGSLKYDNICARMRTESVDPILLGQQGLETREVFDMMVQPATLAIEEFDQIEIRFPANHRFFGERFRILKVRDQGMHTNDPRAYLLLTIDRSDIAHAIQ